MYVIRETDSSAELRLWTVGYYDPDGDWEAHSDHHTLKEAEQKCSYLNGGNK